MTSISYQLYSSRNFPQITQTLKMLIELGYQNIEGYGGLFENLNQLRTGLDETGLTMRSAHFDLDILRENPSGVLEMVKTLNIEYVFCPYLLPEKRPNNASGWRNLGRELQELGKPFRDSGLTFGWHNHDFELQHQADGSLPLEEMFDGAPDVSWEIDVAWIERAGFDPIEWIRKYAGRISAVHVKDLAPPGECEDEDGWADVGFGIVDWPRIWKELAKTQASLFVIEHDNPNDHQRFARRSLTAVRDLQSMLSCSPPGAIDE